MQLNMSVKQMRSKRAIRILAGVVLPALRMNGTDSHTLSLNAGDVLQVEFETSKGSLHIKITAPDGTIIYAGNGEETTSFEINIPETGPYTVAVQARHAEGRIHIRLKAS